MKRTPLHFSGKRIERVGGLIEQMFDLELKIAVDAKDMMAGFGQPGTPAARPSG